MKRLSIMSIILVFVVLLAFGISCASSSAPAAPPAPSSGVAPGGSSAKPAWEQRWDEIVAAAKAEGSVTIYSSNAPETRQKVSEAVQKRFGVRVEWVVGSSNELVQKMLAERSANIYNADAMLGGTMSTMNFLKPAGMIRPLEPDLMLPEVTDVSKWFQRRLWWVDKERMHLAYAVIAQPAIVVNTDLVKEGEITSFNDLLNPKWKGKMLIDSPFIGGTGNEWVTGVGSLIMGDDYLREIAKQEPFIVHEKRLGIEWITRGKYAISLSGSTDTIAMFVRAGASNLKVITPKEGTTVSQSNGAISILNKPAHPNAARLLLNWVLSREGQETICRPQGLQSARIDVPTDWVEPWTLRQEGVKYYDTISFEYNLKKQEYVELAKKIFPAK